MNPNKILGIAPGASAQEVQTAFRKKAFESHPDQNQSPEAIEAFIRIKEARDALMKQALEQPDTTAKDASTARQAAQRAANSTAAATFQSPSSDAGLYDDMTPEELAHIQKLDRLANEYIKKSLFKKSSEAPEVTKHRKRIETTNRRLDGRY